MAPKSKVIGKFLSALKCASGSTKRTVSIEDLYNCEGILKERWGTYTNLTDKYNKVDPKNALSVLSPLRNDEDDESIIDSINESFRFLSDEETLSEESDKEPAVSVAELISTSVVLPAVPEVAVVKLESVVEKPVEEEPIKMIKFRPVLRTLYTIPEVHEPTEEEEKEMDRLREREAAMANGEESDEDDIPYDDSDSEDDETPVEPVKPKSDILWEMNV